MRQDPILDPAFTGPLRDSAKAAAWGGTGNSRRAMASSGWQAVAAVAAALSLAGMIFVRNQNRSHEPDEGMRIEELMSACAVRTARAAEAAG